MSLLLQNKPLFAIYFSFLRRSYADRLESAGAMEARNVDMEKDEVEMGVEKEIALTKPQPFFMIEKGNPGPKQWVFTLR